MRLILVLGAAALAGGCGLLLGGDDLQGGLVDAATTDAGGGTPDAGPPLVDGCTPVPETCNLVDDDCDSLVDEESVGAPICEGGQLCGESGTCEDEVCAPSSGEMFCFGPGCTDVLSDDQNCGSCGAICPDTAFCREGGCQAEAKHVAVGLGYTCALLRGGVTWCWGAEAVGELGDSGSPMGTHGPEPTVGPHARNSTNIDGGTGHACTLHSDGSVSCWGTNESRQCGTSAVRIAVEPWHAEGFTGSAGAVTAGGEHTCVLEGGRVSCWGLNDDGQVGASTGSTHTNAYLVSMSGSPTAISAGHDHTCAVADMNVLCWGSNIERQLGNALVPESSRPMQVMGVQATDVAAGAQFTCAIRTTGEVACWGNNWYGQVGAGDSVLISPRPVMVRTLDAATDITVGVNHACAIQGGSGTVWCWGSNATAQLGGGFTGPSSNIPIEAGLTEATEVEAGFLHTCAVTREGSVWCWGSNVTGQVGPGAASFQDTPYRVDLSVPAFSP